MKRILCIAVACLLLAPAFATADDVKPEDLLGKWELTEDVAKLPKGSIFEFQKDGKLVIAADIGGKKTFEFKYELKAKEKRLSFIIGDKTETTAIVTLNDKELVCQDKDGTSPKFKRVK